METPEKLRATALMLFDMANRTASFQRQEELIARAEHLENRARELEEEPESRIRLEQELEGCTDPYMRVKIQSALDNLTDGDSL